jgi:hypothetical protein
VFDVELLQKAARRQKSESDASVKISQLIIPPVEREALSAKDSEFEGIQATVKDHQDVLNM